MVVSEDENVSTGNPGWASAMQNILKTEKPKSKSSVILSRAKVLNSKIDKDDSESSDDEKNTKSAIKSGTLKREWMSRGRSKPKLDQRERERHLRSTALSGVVQLFNAVGKHQALQKNANSKSISNSGSLNKLDKASFFNILNSKINSDKVETVEPKEEVKSEPWEVLRTDFMMSTKLKNWDTQEDVES